MGNDREMTISVSSTWSWVIVAGNDRGIMKVALLLNNFAKAGRANDYLEQVLNRLKFHGQSPDILLPNSADQVKKEVSESSADRIIVVGGDGSLHYAANALANTDRTLGLIPLGTGNDAARALGISDGDLVDYVDRTLEDPSPIDLVKSGSRYFVTSCIMGFPSKVNQRSNAMQFPKGQSRYTVATLAELKSLESERYWLELDERNFEIEATAVVVANTSFFGGGMKICPQADPCDGILDICVLGDVSRMKLLHSFTKIRNGSHVHESEVFLYRSHSIGIRADGRARADGEPYADLPLTMKVQPNALLVAGVRLA